jgi:hypothetical protein
MDWRATGIAESPMVVRAAPIASETGGAAGMKPQPTAPVPRVTLTREEAAAALGVSLSHFERHVQPELRLIYSGSARLVPVRELETWAQRAATLAGDNTQSQRPPRRWSARGPGPKEHTLP